MWTEIRSLSDKIPIIASMSDRAMGAGYYVAMGAGVIVAENLTLINWFNWSGLGNL